MAVRVLTSADVEDLVTFDDAVACLETAFCVQAKGGVAAWPPSLMRSDGALLILRSGGIAGQHRMGVRVTTGPHNPSYALVYDTPSGRLKSFMAYPFSDLRLDATVALGTRVLAPATVRQLTLLGTGRLALGLIESVCRVRPVERIAAFSRHEGPRREFAAKASAALGIPVTPVDDPERAVSDSDMVLVITNATTPALHGSWLAPGAFVVAAGLRSEVDDEVFIRASQIVTTSKVQEMNVHDYREDWPLVRALRSRNLDFEAHVLELGQVIAGEVARSPGIVVLREAQGGFGDIALASLGYERALALGRGVELDIS
ncbi:MAG TPA: hypothetical protein VFC51_19385 [Chloroflexota bacterium]|nr:hypothetical protein [Chloroflexota bacterium]